MLESYQVITDFAVMGGVKLEWLPRLALPIRFLTTTTANDYVTSKQRATGTHY